MCETCVILYNIRMYYAYRAKYCIPICNQMTVCTKMIQSMTFYILKIQKITMQFPYQMATLSIDWFQRTTQYEYFVIHLFCLSM